MLKAAERPSSPRRRRILASLPQKFQHEFAVRFRPPFRLNYRQWPETMAI